MALCMISFGPPRVISKNAMVYSNTKRISKFVFRPQKTFIFSVSQENFFLCIAEELANNSLK